MAETLAQRIKQKYPGKYDDMPDVELERRVLETYPGVYDDLPRTPTTTGPELVTDPSAMSQVGRQMLLGTRALGEGAMTLPAMGADAIGLLMNLGIDAYNRGAGASVPLFRPQGQVLSENLTAAGLPAPETATERVIADINRGAGAAATSALAAGAIAPASRVGQGVQTALAARPGAQIVSAGAGAGASGVTRESGGGPAAQLAAGVLTGAAVYSATASLGDKLAGMRLENWKTPKVKQVMEASKKHDVPVTYGDVSGAARKAETTLEKIPGIGIAGVRERQHDEALVAARQLKDEFGSGSGPEWAEVARESLSRRVGRMKQTASSMYDEIGALSADKSVPIGRTLTKLDDEISASGGSILESGLGPKLQKIRDNLAEAYRKGNFEALRQFRSDLGDAIGSTSDRKEIRALTGVKRALEEDMADFAQKQGGQLWEKWRAADKFYATELVPARKLAERFNKIDDPDALYNAFLKAATTRPQTLYDAMGPTAKAAVRYGMVNEAFERALNDDKFSPAKFAGYLERNQRAVGVMFEGEDKKLVDGFTVLMRHAQRAGQFKENPPTGNRGLMELLMLAGPSAVIGAVNAPAGGTAAVATLGSLTAMRLLFTTDAGKKLLLTVSQHPKDAAFVDGALRYYAPLLGSQSSSKEQKAPTK